jgi:hypothetical protein
MVWGIFRIVLFTSAFLFGVLATDSVDANSLGEARHGAAPVSFGCREFPMPEKIPAAVRLLGPVAVIFNR